MKIVVYEDSSKVSFGGGQRVTMQVLRAINDLFTSVEVFDFSESSRFFQRMKVEGYSINLLSRRWPSVILLIKLVILSVMRKNLPKPSECILYSTTKLGLILCWLQNFFWGYRFIHHCHLVERHSAVLNFLYRRAVKVVFVSRLAMGSYRKPNGVVIYNGVDPVLPPKPISTGRLTIAYIGSITEDKGAFDFLNAIKILDIDTADFRIYGAGSEIAEQRASALAAAVGAKFQGFCEDVMALISREIDIVVYPSKLIEAFPMVVLETIACGKYILTTDFGGQCKLVCMLQIPMIHECSPTQIAISLQRVIENLSEKSASIYQRKTIEVMCKFSAAKFAVDMKQVFHEAIRLEG